MSDVDPKVTADPEAIGILFANLRSLDCKMIPDGGLWTFDAGRLPGEIVTLRLLFPDESQRRYTHEWHIGVERQEHPS